MRILVVDDSAGIRTGISGALCRAGHVCDLGGNGIEGLKFALRRVYDLILSDIHMPGMDGLKFIQRVRMSGPNVKTPILIFSSCREEEMVLAGAKLGIQGYIVKPTDASTMVEAVNSIFAVIGTIE